MDGILCRIPILPFHFPPPFYLHGLARPRLLASCYPLLGHHGPVHSGRILPVSPQPHLRQIYFADNHIISQLPPDIPHRLAGRLGLQHRPSVRSGVLHCCGARLKLSSEVTSRTCTELGLDEFSVDLVPRARRVGCVSRRWNRGSVAELAGGIRRAVSRYKPGI